MSRNPLIFGLFTRMHVVEKVGSGIPRMRRLMKDAGLPEPKFDSHGFFTVTFMKRAKTNRANDGTINGMINERENMIFNLIQDNGGISAVELSHKASMGLRTVMRTIKSLVEKDFIEYRGAKKNGGYYMK